MGVHTGDSITVAPAQTLTDKEYQIMRDASIAVLREIGVETGGSNVQFAVNPDDGRMIVIEMNPRVSRSSALASKATGFPIAKIAAKLAVGYTLDELRNDITGGATPASFEPTIDYVVTKIPRFAFEKFPQADARLTTQMKSVGEVMAIGRTFQESLQKALRGLETGIDGFDPMVDPDAKTCDDRVTRRSPARRRAHLVRRRRVPHGHDRWTRCSSTPRSIRWFLAQIEELVRDGAADRAQRSLAALDDERMRSLKRKGFSDRAAGRAARHRRGSRCAQRRHALGVRPVYKRVDTCAAEFAAEHRLHVLDLRGGVRGRADRPARRSWCSAAGRTASARASSSTTAACTRRFALREDGYETIMVNCNPETVSTDYDTSDRLYFEPLTLEDVLEIVDKEKPARRHRAVRRPDAAEAGADLEARRRADHRHLARLDRPRRGPRALPEAAREAGPASSRPTARRAPRTAGACGWPQEIGYPLVVRPSYVLGGRAMEIVHDEEDLRALHARGGQGVQRVAGAARPLPRRRDRGRRRRDLRRRATW